MRKIRFAGRWVLVTGASGGLGREIALVLAEQEEANLIVASRRIEKLEQLKREIEGSTKSQVVVIQADLSQSEDVDMLFERSTSVGDVFALVNNAGLTFYGKTVINRWPDHEKIFRVNLLATMKLSLKFLAYFQEKGRGAILNISSQGAFVSIPFQSVYSATKSAVQTFSEGLREENRGSGVIICTYAPGGIDTEMLSTSGIKQNVPDSGIFTMTPRLAAVKAIRALKRGKALTIPGLVNKLIYCLVRHFPRRLVVRITGWIYRPKSSAFKKEE